MKALCVGDLHLNERSGLGPERLQDQEDAWRDALNVARDEQVDVVLFAGDAFEHRRPTPAELRAFQKPLEDFLDVTADFSLVLAIPGNHDVSHPDEPIALDLFGDVLALRRTPDVEQFDDVAVATLPWTPVSRLVAEANGGDRDDLNAVSAEHLVNVARGLRDRIDGPAILLAHWSVSGASTPDGLGSEHFREPVLDHNALIDQGWGAIVAGHIHKPQFLGQRPDATIWVQRQDDYGEGVEFYVGSPLPLNHGEASCEHGVWILEGPPFAARFVPLESRRFITLDFTSGIDPDTWVEISEWEPGAIVRARYTATEELARRIDNTAIRRDILDRGAWRATVEPTIVREQRARVEAMTAELSDRDALNLWLAELAVDERMQLAALLTHEKYVGGAR